MFKGTPLKYSREMLQCPEVTVRMITGTLAPGGRTVVWRVTPLAFLGAHVSSCTLLPPSLFNVPFYSKAAWKANKQIQPSRDIKVTILGKKKKSLCTSISSPDQRGSNILTTTFSVWFTRATRRVRSCLGRVLRLFVPDTCTHSPPKSEQLFTTELSVNKGYTAHSHASQKVPAQF